MTLEQARFPIGRWQYSGMSNEAEAAARVERLRLLPEQLRAVLLQGGEARLDVEPRPGAWTPRQIVHHLADAHANLTIRVRLILTEEQPKVKPFDENTWAELVDASSAPVEESLRILDGLHSRIARLLATRPHSDLAREMLHPEQGLVPLDRLLSYLDWHGRHHTAQIAAAL
ncbi:YfiT family bacillithiol transferase [Bryobacter aggregatus]|uniref:YfiT family bacillithiol transferase n=1 Tax=Bryobacter aggregatus TaxID=360054 RepID=UPI0004E12FB0|nr:putative metal-dependent hydrolase [Bryobacter aggregatus]